MKRVSLLSGLALLLLVAACAPAPTSVATAMRTTAPATTAVATTTPAAEPTATFAAPAAATEPAGTPPGAGVGTPVADETGSAPDTFSDPFAYCTAVGTADEPDQRYTGQKMPDAIVDGLQGALGLSGTPSPAVTQTSVWRCMDGKVYACTVGANLPCTEKANRDKTPTQEMKDFCQANPDSDFIPAYVTGHNVVYEWQCKAGVPQAGKELWKVDARGFVADIWYQISR